MVDVKDVVDVEDGVDVDDVVDVKDGLDSGADQEENPDNRPYDDLLTKLRPPLQHPVQEDSLQNIQCEHHHTNDARWLHNTSGLGLNFHT